MQAQERFWDFEMSAQIDEADNDADRYASMVLHYSHNAEKYLKIKDYHKASEMMWGAMSCCVKTVAATKNESIKSHRQLGEYARKIAKMENDKEVFYSFSQASMLHSNFYESNLDPNTVLAIVEGVSKTIGKLMKKMGYRAP